MSTTQPTLAELAGDWELSLASDNKSPATIKTYRTAVAQLGEYLEANDRPTVAAEVRREDVQAFLADLLTRRSAGTAKTRHGALVTFFNWAVDVGELDATPMAKVSAPKVPEQPVPVISTDQLGRLLEVTKGSTFLDRRDHAMLRLFIDTGVRRAEMAGITLDDLDLEDRVVWVMGKGRRARRVGFGNKTTLALRRYLRLREQHPWVVANRENPTAPAWLWLGKLGPLGPAGIAQMLERRGPEAGIEGLHAHQFRHTYAHRHLAAGGTEGHLRAVAGWRDRRMLDRYGASVAAERAIDEQRRLGLGDAL
ncbi:MAG: tyrosine-type recombinase/integrase [Acidimicrobiales bacterium]